MKDERKKERNRKAFTFPGVAHILPPLAAASHNRRSPETVRIPWAKQIQWISSPYTLYASL
jgi:hypothetical protein